MQLKTAIRSTDSEFRRALLPFAKAASDALMQVLQTTPASARADAVQQWRSSWETQARAVNGIRLTGPLKQVENQVKKRLEKAGIDPSLAAPPQQLPARAFIQTRREQFISQLAGEAEVAATISAPLNSIRARSRQLRKGVDKSARTLASRIVHIAATKTMQEALQSSGTSKFIWRTSGDSRVRREHRPLEGQVFSLSRGAPSAGFPGEAFGCRCWMEPYVPGRNR